MQVKEDGREKERRKGKKATGRQKILCTYERWTNKNAEQGLLYQINSPAKFSKGCFKRRKPRDVAT